eukprot:PhM_4_TR13418/c0_g1_i1/m.58415
MDVVITPQTTTTTVRGAKRCDLTEGLVATLRMSGVSKTAAPTTFACVCAHPSDGERLLAGDSRGTVLHVSLSRNRCHVVARLSSQVTALAFATTMAPAMCLAASGGHLLVLGIEDGKVHHRLKGQHLNRIDGMQAMGRLCITKSSDAAVVWDLTTLKPLHTVVCVAPCLAVLLTPRNIAFVSNSEIILRDRVHIEDVGSLVLPEERPIEAHGSTAANAPGSHIVSGCLKNSMLVVYDVQARTCSRIVALPHERVRGVAAVDWVTSEQIAVLSSNLSLFIVNGVTGPTPKLLYSFEACGRAAFASCVAMAVMSSGQHCAVALSDGGLRLWHLETARTASKLRNQTSTAHKPLKSFVVDFAHCEAAAAGPRRAASASSKENVPPSDVQEHHVAFAATHAELRPVIDMPEGEEASPMPAPPVPSRIPDAARVTCADRSSWIYSELTAKRYATLPARSGVRDELVPGGAMTTTTTAMSGKAGKLKGTKSNQTVRILPRGEAALNSAGTAFPDLTIQLKLDDDTKEYNMERLHALLITYGVFPERFRALIWKFILRLHTTQTNAFEVLAKKGVHSAALDLLNAYPLPGSRLKLALERVLSCLSHHAPVFAHIRFLPEIVFPFVKVYQSDNRSAFEAVLVWFLNWGKEFVRYYPQPPVALLVSLEELLLEYDAELHTHMTTIGCGVDVWGWGVMRGMYSAILSRNEWLQVMDHAFSNQPVWLWCFHVSWLHVVRRSVLALGTYAELEAFFLKNSPCDLHLVLRGSYSLHKKLNKQNSLLTTWRDYVSFVPITCVGDTYPAFLDFPEYAEQTATEQAQVVTKYEQAIERSERNIKNMRTQLDRIRHDEEVCIRRERAIARGRQQHKEDVWLSRLKMQRDLQMMLDREAEVKLHLAEEQRSSTQRFVDVHLEQRAAQTIDREDLEEQTRQTLHWERHNADTAGNLDEIARRNREQYEAARALVDPPRPNAVSPVPIARQPINGADSTSSQTRSSKKPQQHQQNSNKAAESTSTTKTKEKRTPGYSCEAAVECNLIASPAALLHSQSVMTDDAAIRTPTSMREAGLVSSPSSRGRRPPTTEGSDDVDVGRSNVRDSLNSTADYQVSPPTDLRASDRPQAQEDDNDGTRNTAVAAGGETADGSTTISQTSPAHNDANPATAVATSTSTSHPPRPAAIAEAAAAITSASSTATSVAPPPQGRPPLPTPAPNAPRSSIPYVCPAEQSCRLQASVDDDMDFERILERLRKVHARVENVVHSDESGTTTTTTTTTSSGSSSKWCDTSSLPVECQAILNNIRNSQHELEALISTSAEERARDLMERRVADMTAQIRSEQQTTTNTTTSSSREHQRNVRSILRSNNRNDTKEKDDNDDDTFEDDDLDRTNISELLDRFGVHRDDVAHPRFGGAEDFDRDSNANAHDLDSSTTLSSSASSTCRGARRDAGDVLLDLTLNDDSLLEDGENFASNIMRGVSRQCCDDGSSSSSLSETN